MFGVSFSPVTVLSRLFEVYRNVPSAGSIATQVGPAPIGVANAPTAPDGRARHRVDRVALHRVRVVVDHVDQLAGRVDGRLIGNSPVGNGPLIMGTSEPLACTV